ncbi:hypothetical protein LMJ63_25975, partial [Escherichia coli]|nr:hypothetical protein [Escherichia coli]
VMTLPRLPTSGEDIEAQPQARQIGGCAFNVARALVHLASAASLLLSAYSLTLPRCPTNRAAESKSWVSVLGLDALVLFRQRRMALFFLFAMLLGAALQITNTFGNPFLH